jgi:hypothetical protein
VIKVDTSNVIERLQTLYGVKTDAALAKKLRVSSGAIHNWRARETVPYEQVVHAALHFGCNLRWLMLGDVENAPAMLRDNLRQQRMTQFIAQWTETHDENEQTWLEVQLARAVPEYREWLMGNQVMPT